MWREERERERLLQELERERKRTHKLHLLTIVRKARREQEDAEGKGRQSKLRPLILDELMRTREELLSVTPAAGMTRERESFNHDLGETITSPSLHHKEEADTVCTLHSFSARSNSPKKDFLLLLMILSLHLIALSKAES